MADSQPNAIDDLANAAPVMSEALTDAQAEDKLTALFGSDPETDLADETKGAPPSDADEAQGEIPPDDEELDPADLPEDDETVDPVDDEDGPDAELKGGRFAPDTAKVTLEDGTVITVADLKRNNLFQRDYSKKTEEVARERAAVTKEREEFSQLQAQVQKEREYALWYLEQNAPQEPQRPTPSASQDPMSWLQYQEDMGKYQTVVQAWQAFHQGKQADVERGQQEQKANLDKFISNEREALFTAIPILKDEGKRKVWFEGNWTKAQKNYGFTAEELNGITDHRVLRALNDANKYQEARAKAPAVQKEVQARPTVAQGSGRRPNAEASARRETDGLRKQLRETGSEAAAEVLIAKMFSRQQ